MLGFTVAGICSVTTTLPPETQIVEVLALSVRVEGLRETVQ